MAGAAAPGPAASSLVAVEPSSPWTLRDLQRLPVELVSHDPDTGITYVIATAAQQQLLHSQGFRTSTVTPDVEAARRRVLAQADLGQYHTYDEMVVELEELAATYPDRCRLETIGQSVEGRAIHALKISDDPFIEDASEPDVLIVGNHHARELMSVEVPLYVAHHLLSQASNSRLVDELVRNREIWIVPMLNPDGHVFQEIEQETPGWRKNRRPNPDGSIGVDLNRNYGTMWGHDDVGSSPDPVSQTYRGSAAFSEPETQAIRQWTESHDFVIAVSYHSFGELVLYPWGWTDVETTPDHPVFVALADSMVRDNGYRPGNAYNGVIYLTNGDFDDWMYGATSASKPRQTFSFTVELNSAAQGGFWPDESLIQPTCDRLLSLNLFAIRVAQEDLRSVLPPPVPVLTLQQDEQDPRHLDLSWTLSQDPVNTVDHYEVFEIDPVGSGSQKAISLQQSGRAVIATGIPVPDSGDLVLRVSSDLERLWDFVYVEARRSGTTTWTTLRNDRMQATDPTGRNEGYGISLSTTDARVVADATTWRHEPVDIAVRLVAHADSPRHPSVQARLDLAQTLTETRRVVADDIHATHYSYLAERAGIFAYGVTAVDVQGQRTDSEPVFVFIPEVTDVAVHDIRVQQAGRSIVLRWQTTSRMPARFVAWSRPLQPGEQPASLQEEWSSGRYRRAASISTTGPGLQQLRWHAAGERHAVILQGEDGESARVWGPWLVTTVLRTALHAAVPNPFNPRTRLVFDLERAGPVTLDIVDVHGRRVRRLRAGPHPAGSDEVIWDGCDDAGRQVASGIYLATLRAAGILRTQRLVLLR
jgi:hypothetical protein